MRSECKTKTTLLKIGAVIVTYFPKVNVRDTINSILDQVDHIIIIDNTPDESSGKILNQIVSISNKINIIFNLDNLGIATALNNGISYLESINMDYAITFDQDSIATKGMIATLLNTHKIIHNKVALVGPSIYHEKFDDYILPTFKKHKHIPFFFTRERCNSGIHLSKVTMIITSGALIKIETFNKIGPFKDKLFIDYVDTEYCLRSISMGYEIILNCKAKLLHNLGDQKKVFCFGICLKPTNHAPIRHYYISRNRIYMLKKYAFKVPHWFCYDLLFGTMLIIKVILTEKNKRQKLKAFLTGLFDGINGKYGKKSE